MKLKVNKSFSIFVFIALFLLFTNAVFAITEEELLKNIINESEVMNYVGKGIDDTPTSSYYVLETKYNLSEYLNDSKDALKIDGKEYLFKIKYTNSEGEEIELSDSEDAFVNYEEQNAYVHYLTGKPDVKNVTYSLIPKGGNGNEISLDKKLKVNTNSKGEIVPKEKIVSKIKRTNAWSVGWGLVTGDITRLTRYITESLCSMALPCGDSFLHMLSASIGEPVSIDTVVYNKVNKLNIDFFDDSSDSASSTTLTTPLKNILKDIVNSFYSFFRNITLTVYMVILVYIGLKMLLTSTAQKKSGYKALFTAWVMGIAMLFFFPYVMKYSIQLNNALCTWIGSAQAENTTEDAPGVLTPNAVPNSSFIASASTYGKDEFVMMMLGMDSTSDAAVADFRQKAVKTNAFGSNVMMRIRFLAAHNLDFPLAVVYFILIGELIALLVIYYKRVFMLAFLISIFPLVVAIYPLNKIGEIKINSFGVWFKEFLVNVFVQSFHAVTYTVIVTVGVNSYIKNDNWLFMIMCILFLFEGEKIIRAIFNAKSSINTIGDMAAAGVMAMRLTQSATKFIPTLGKDKAASSDAAADAKAKKDRKKPSVTRAPGTDTVGAATNLAEGTGGTSGGSTPGGGTPSEGVSGPVVLGREPDAAPHGYSTVRDSVDKRATKGKLGKTSSGIAGGAGAAFSFGTQVTGATLGTTFGMAQRDGKKGMDTAIASGVSGMNMGKEIGNGGKALLGGIAGKISRVHAGYAVAKEYESGARDDEIGIPEADRAADNAKANAMREVYAKAARSKGKWGNDVAEIVFMRDILKRYKDDE